MGRSGTSALTRVLALCGGTLAQALLGATDGNALGHWEPSEALALNEAFLGRHGSTWYDPTLRLQGEVAFDQEESAAYLQQIQSFLRSLPAGPFAVVKEPRITALSEFWFRAAREIGLPIGVVIAIRHPEEVVASLAARDQASVELSQALWLKNNLLAERHSRAVPRVFVEYAALLRNWRNEVARIASALSLDLSVQDETAIDAFLRQDMRRQRHEGGGISETFGTRWISQVYTALSGAARSEPLDTGILDDVFSSFRATERAFRVSLEEYRMRFAPAEAKRRPNIARLIYAVGGPDSQLLRSALASKWYVERNPDIFAARCDPYEHWLARGIEEGRLPCDDPLALLDALMRERMSRPATAAQAPVTTLAAAPRATRPAAPDVPSEPEKIRIVCATRQDRESFYSTTALGKSLALYRPAGVELRLFAGNTRGLAEIYNTAIAESATEREILLFVHDDVHLCDFYWADRLREGLGAFDIVGLAGNRRRVSGQPGWGMTDQKLTGDARGNSSGIVAHGRGYPADSVDVFGPTGQKVVLLDGLFLAVRSQALQSKSLRFDERFDFHFYDLDFCRQAEQAGLSMGTWPIAVVHESKGGYAGDGWRRGYREYLQKWGE